MPDDAPLISCLMVTRDRLALAQRAIRSYADQTYANRELVIVTDGSEEFLAGLQQFVKAEKIGGVRFVDPGEPDLPLGRLRNLSMDAARGEIVCQWDDDDLSHPARLAMQAECMFRYNARACFLADHLQYLADAQILYWVDWTKEGASKGASQVAPGTAMIYRDARFRYPESGEKARQGEDSVLLFHLFDLVPVAILREHGHLYLYQYHGRNTYSRDHHAKLSRCRTPNAWLAAREAEIREAVSHYRLPRPIEVTGREGLAFTVD